MKVFKHHHAQKRTSQSGELNVEAEVEAEGPGDGGERNGLWPPGGLVNHGQEVAEPLTGGQGSHQIQMDVGKFSTMERNQGDWRLHMRLDFTLLTPETRSSPEDNILGEAGPHKPGGQEPPRSTSTRMRETMENRNS